MPAAACDLESAFRCKRGQGQIGMDLQQATTRKSRGTEDTNRCGRAGIEGEWESEVWGLGGKCTTEQATKTKHSQSIRETIYALIEPEVADAGIDRSPLATVTGSGRD